MPQYDNRNSGVLFKNKKKDSDKHPDYTGSYTDGDGNEFWLSAWIKTSNKNGEKFMSLSTQSKDAQKQSGEENQASSEEVPF